jgi:hypothetical protein
MHRLNLEVLEERRLLAFSPAVSYFIGGHPTDPFVQSQPLVTADFNNDTVLDLAVGNTGSFSYRVSVLLGNGDGSFHPALNSATGEAPLSLAVGDFDRDGNSDLAIANANSDLAPNAYDVSVLRGNGDGTFQAAGSFFLGEGVYPQAVAVGDFNGDGLLDLGVTSESAYHPYYYGQDGNATVLLGNGDFSFSGPNTTPLGWGDHYAAVAADLNDDGIDDFVTVNSLHLTSRVNVLFGNSSGYLQGPSSFSTGGYSRSVAAADLDADGDIDLVTGNMASDKVGVLLGNGAGSFSAAVKYAAGWYSAAVALGDFTGDGHVDVAAANYYQFSNLSVLPGRGDGTFSPWMNFAVGSNPDGVAAGDFNGDGWLDVATSNNGGSNVSVLINDQSWFSPPPPSVRTSDMTVTETDAGTWTVGFNLTLSYASSVDVTVHYATADITAVAGSDYVAASGTVTIPAGQTIRALAVLIKGDVLLEPTETFAVNLSAPTNATIGDGQAIGTILDNDVAPRISISDVTKAEGKKGKTTTFTFTVTLSAAYDQPVTMSFRTVNGTATTGDSDYIAKTGTLTFLPGERTKTITIEVKGDSKKESNETFYLDLYGLSSNALFTKTRGLGTILNDD